MARRRGRAGRAPPRCRRAAANGARPSAGGAPRAAKASGFCASLRGNSFDPIRTLRATSGASSWTHLEEEVSSGHEVEDLGDERSSRRPRTATSAAAGRAPTRATTRGRPASRPKVLEAGRVDRQHLVRPVRERLGGGERRLARRHVAPVAAVRPPAGSASRSRRPRAVPRRRPPRRARAQARGLQRRRAPIVPSPRGARP